MTVVRCPMRECRRRFDLDALPGEPAEQPCLHFIVAWGERRGSLTVELLHALDGNRELAIRNVRASEYDPAAIEVHAAAAGALAERYGHVVDGVALFGDQHERDALARELAQLLIGPDPMVYRAAGP